MVTINGVLELNVVQCGYAPMRDAVVRRDGEWRSRMAPWLRTLRALRLTLRPEPLPTQQQLEDTWVDLTAFDEFLTLTPDEWPHVLHAMELLDLLVRVDAALGWDLLLETADVDVSFSTNYELMLRRDRVRPKYSFPVDASLNAEALFRVLQETFGARQESERVDGTSCEEIRYETLKRDLAVEWSRQHNGTEFDRRAHGRVEMGIAMTVWPEYTFNTPEHVLLQAIGRLTREQNEAQVDVGDEERRTDVAFESERPPRTAAFHLAETSIFVRTYGTTDDVLDCAQRIARYGVRLAELELTDFTCSEPASCADNYWSTLLRPFRHASPPCTKTPGVRALRLQCPRFDPRDVMGICTAIAHSACLEEIRFIPSTGDQNRGEACAGQWLLWLAYAVFGPHTRHHIQRASISMDQVPSTQILAMRELLQHPDPLALLCNINSPSPVPPLLLAQPRSATLSPQSPVYHGHYGVDETQVDATSLPTNARYHIVRDVEQEAFIEIVVPGSGVCWVDRSNVENLQPLTRRDGCPVRCLNLVGVSQDSQSSTLELLQLFGTSVEELTLTGCQVDEFFMDTLRVTCSSLKRLNLADVRVARLDWLLSPPSDGQVRYQLESLQLDWMELESRTITQLFKTLCDPEHALTRSLKEFSYTSSEVYPFRNVESSWIKMLKENTILERCEIVIGEDEETMNRCYNRSRKFHLTPIAVQKEPLTLRQKVAVLSVLAQPIRTNKEEVEESEIEVKSCCMIDLPVEALSLIMQMAAVNMHRVCGVASARL